jgi:hypothetical protein
MSDVRFKITPVAEKPTRKDRRKRFRKYAPIIDAFLESEHRMVRVEDTGLEGSYLSVQLKRLYKERGIDTVTVSVVNKEVYLEK